MFRVGFIVPTWHYWVDPFKHQPYWEMYYATVIRQAFPEDDLEIDMVDLRGVPGDTLTEVVNNLPERDLYCYWIMKAGDALEVYSIVKLLKDMYPRSAHVAGGTHIDMLPEECESKFDSIIIGPGENSFPKVINDVRSAAVSSVYRQSYLEVPFRDTPFPRREFLPRSHVINNTLFSEDGSVSGTAIYFSRGCVYHCAFCVYNVPNMLQMRSPEMMAAELDYLKQNYHIAGVLLKDEVAIHPNSRYSKQVCDALYESGLIWRGQTTSLATLAQLKEAARSGCRELSVGVETVDEQVMKICNKEWQNEEKIRNFILNAKEVGIRVKVCLILGLPGEPPDIVAKSIKFLEDTRPEYVSISGFCPFPGSPMFKNYQYYGIKYIDHDWSKHSHLLYRFADDEEIGLPFEYEEYTRWGKSFSREEIAQNIQTLQHWAKERRMLY